METKGLKKPERFLILGLLLGVLIAVAAYGIFFYPAAPYPINPSLSNFHGGEGIGEAGPESHSDDVGLLARVIQGEAGSEPYLGKVAVAAVLLNRISSSSFPNSLSGVVFEPYAFESVSNGLIWQFEPSSESLQAAEAALSGWDPTYGSLFFWNPSKPVTPWIWTREILTEIGNHVFAR